jgi:DNA polymerase (family 10)
MDPEGSLIRQARERGALFCVSADAHDVAGLANADLGVGMARRGWLETRHVLNARDAEQVALHLRQRRARAEAAAV